MSAEYVVDEGSLDDNADLTKALSMREAAVALALENFRVIPLPPRQKRANLLKWQELATTDRAQVERWFPVTMAEHDLLGNTEPNIGIVAGRGLLVVDIDPRHGGDISLITLQKERGQLPQTRSVRTPSGGRHLYFRVPEDGHVPNSASKLGAGLDIRGDGGYVAAPPSVTDAGSYAWENDAPITDAPSWLIELATQARQLKETNNSGAGPVHESPKHDSTLADFIELLNHLDPNCGYQEWFEICVSASRAAAGTADGSTPSQWFEALNEWSSRSPKYEGRGSVLAKWQQAGTRGHGYGLGHLIALARAGGWEPPPRVSDGSEFPPVVGAPPPPPLEHVLLSEFLNDTEPDWLVEDVLMQGSVLAAMYAPPGAGKSTLLVEMLMAIARGVPWHGHDVEKEQGAVAYLAAESVGGLRKRLKAYAKSNGIEFEALNDMFFPVPSSINLLNSDDVARLIKYLKTLPTKHPLRVLAVDTLRRRAGANESTSDGMGPALAACKRIHVETGALIVLIHHSGKDQTKGMRGWSGILGALDTEIEVLWDKATKSGTVSVTKQRDGESDFKLFDFEIQKVVYGTSRKGREVSSVVIREVAAKPESGIIVTDLPNSTVRRAIRGVLGDAMRAMSFEELITAVKPKLVPSQGKKITIATAPNRRSSAWWRIANYT